MVKFSKFALGGLTAMALTMAAQAAWADMKIAVAGPMTGQYANFGEQMKRGAELAVKHLNAKGGINGQQIQLEVLDDACDPKQAVAVANKAVQVGLPFVAGHFCSGSSIPASEVYADEGIVQITPASTNPQLTENGRKNVFRVCGRDDQQGQTAAKYTLENFKGKNVAIIDDKSAYGKGLADEYRKAFNAGGGKEVLVESISQGDKDFSALVTKVKAAKADLIYFGGYHSEAGLIVRQLREQGLSAVTLMSGDALVSQEYWAITGETGEGTLMTFDADPRKNPANASLVKEFKDGGYEPEGYTIYTYAAIQAYAQAATKAGGTDSAKVIAALQSNAFDTALGKIEFDAKGDSKSPAYRVYVWKGGKYDYVNP